MLLKSLKENTLCGLVFALVMFIGMASSSILSYGAWMWIVPESGSLIFDDIRNLLGSLGTPIVLGISFIILTIVEILLMISLNSRFSLIRAKGGLFVVITTAISMCYIPYNVLLPEQFAAVFVMLGLFPILDSNGKDVAVYNLFNAGLFFGVAILFCFNAIIILLFGIAALLVFRPLRINEFLMLIIGIATPILFYFAIYYIINGEIMLVLENIANEFSIQHIFKPEKNSIIFIATAAIWLIISGMLMIKLYNRFNVFETRVYLLLFLIFIITISAGFSPFLSIETIRIALFPAVFMLATIFYNMRNSFWSEIIFTLFLLSSISLHIYLILGHSNN